MLELKDGNYYFKPYNFNIIYHKGSENISDFISRIKNLPPPSRKKDKAEDFINFITVNALPTTITLEEIKNETEKDMELVTLREAVKNNSYRQLNMDKYEKLGTELTIIDGIILQNYRLLIPIAKQLLRSKCFWLGMDSDIEKAISNCLPCQAVARASTSPSVKFTESSKQTWEHTGVDFYGPTPNGQKLLIILDYFSRYPVVEIMNTTTANSVINRLNRLFAIYGFPNGLPWNSTDIKLFFKVRSIKHKRITPLWPRANGLTDHLSTTSTNAL